MSAFYFDSQNSWKRLFFITGLTSDEFFTDSGQKVPIEVLTYLELKASGYERIVFFDPEFKAYCYDDESFALIDEIEHSKEDVSTKRKPRPKKGLKMGKHSHVVKNENENAPQNNDDNDEKKNENTPETQNEAWTPGKNSGIGIKNIKSQVLNIGMQDDAFIARQIQAYMNDDKIKTAVVFNDPTAFITRFSGDMLHSMAVSFVHLPSENKNIIVFIYPDIRSGNIYQVADINNVIGEKDNSKPDTNVIDIPDPNMSEIRNMLMYLRVNHQLKFDIKDLDVLSNELCRAMVIGKKRIRETYDILIKLENYEKLDVDMCYSLLGAEKPVSAKEQLANMVGMKNLKEILSKFDVNGNQREETGKYLTSSRLRPDKPAPEKNDEMIHFVFKGNPGTGKTTAAKLLGQLFYEMGYLEKGHVVETDRSELVSNHVGETAINTRAKVEEALGGVLFIDEAYTLKREQNSHGDFGQEAIDTLCKLMDKYKGKLIVVVAGYPDEMDIFINSNPGLSRRFTQMVDLDDYTPDEMLEILRFHIKKNNAVFSEELEKHIKDFCTNWVNNAGENWGNAGEAVNLVESMIREWKLDKNHRTQAGENNVTLSVLDIKHIPADKRNFLRSPVEMREEMYESINNMTGLEEVKAKISRLRYNCIAGNVTEPGHYMFVGNPGTGKTTVARLMGRIMHDLGLLKRGHMVEYTAADLMSVVFNEDNGGDFSKVARKAINGVLFIDEAYQLATDTTGRGRPIIDSLLTFAENNREKVCIVLAGYDDDMDNFLEQNPGLNRRFSERIHFDNYNGEELCEILMKMLAEKGKTVDDGQEGVVLGYREAALRALTRYVQIHSKDKDFGNAGYVRDVFLKESIATQSERLVRLYGENIDSEHKKILTADDIPPDLKRFTKTPLPPPDNRTALEVIDSLLGYDDIKKELRRLLENARFNRENELGILNMPERLHWVLEGGPGTGKTTIAKLIGKVYKECGILTKGHTVAVTRADLVAGYEGQTAGKTRKCIEKAMGGVLFVDEAYSLTDGGAERGDFGAEAIAELVEKMEIYNGEFAVVFAGYPDKMEDFIRSNPGIAGRVRKFVLEDYDYKELAKIFLIKCNEQKAVPDENLMSRLELLFYNKKRVESKTRDWGNGREAENLLRDMIHEWMQSPVYNEDKTMRVLTVDHVPEGQRRYLRGKLPKKEKKTSAIEDIENLIGFDDLKKTLLDLLQLKKTAEEYGREDLLDNLNFHWVLEGNPGTGKTTVAKLIGKVYKEMGLLERGHTIKATVSDLTGEHVGETPQKTKKVIDSAMGGVLFIDEAYTLKRVGAGGAGAYGQEAIDTLLEQMTDRNGYFAVVAAGYPKEMEVFLNANPGFRSRFDRVFVLKDYNADELLRIFEMKCRSHSMLVGDELKEAVKNIFDNMIKARIRGWANGREAENLERRMLTMWPKNPVASVDEQTGERQYYYTVDHIPDEYRRYMAENNKEDSGEKTDKKNNVTEFSVPADKMPAVKSSFNYEEEYIEQTKSVVLIQVSKSGEEGKGSGSGSIITSDGYILTCNHVIADADDIKVRIKPEGNDNASTVWENAEVMWADEDIDMAVIKIKGSNYPTLYIRPENYANKPGEDIYHWGYPFGSRLSDDLDQLQPSLFQGSTSSIQTKDGLERINCNMEAKRGCSGGPVFSKKDGCIIGILCGSQTCGNERLIEEINFIRPVKYVWENIINKGNK